MAKIKKKKARKMKRVDPLAELFYIVFPPRSDDTWTDTFGDAQFDLSGQNCCLGFIKVGKRKAFTLRGVSVYGGPAVANLLQCDEVGEVVIQDCVLDAPAAAEASPPVVRINNATKLVIERSAGGALLEYNGVPIGRIDDLEGEIPIPVSPPPAP